MSAAEQARAVRRGAGLFTLDSRAVLEVTGGDRVRWLEGQVSNAVGALDPGGPRAGCLALLLTPQARIVSDLYVLVRPECFWLDCDRAAAPRVLERLAKMVIADDVRLEDRSAAVARLGLEGPRAPEILAAVLTGPPELPPDGAAPARIGDVELHVAAFGWSGEPAFQLFVPRAACERVEDALREQGAGHGLVQAQEAALEILRVEAGTPRFGHELDEDALPAETGLLERAVSFTKGCYTGQEIVARMHARAQVKHRLVGLRLEGEETPEAGAVVEVDGRRVGEVTSVARSPRVGAIALAFVARPHDAPGTVVSLGDLRARVGSLPLVAPAGRRA